MLVRHERASVDKRVKRRGCATRSRERVGTALAARIEGLIGIKAGSGCNCKDLSQKMDAWGIKGCEIHRVEIIDALVKNRGILEAALSDKSWLLGAAAKMAPDAVLRAGANHLLDQAIEDARTQTPCHVPRAKHNRGHSRHSRRNWIRPAFNGTFVPDPEWTSEIRHLTYHVWPTKKHDGWKWNLQQLAKQIDLFNGKRILGVVTGSDTDSAATVIDYAASMGISFTHVVERANNSNLREVVTWLPMLELLHPEHAGKNEVVFSAHAKGVRHIDPFAEGSTLLPWTETMYRYCLEWNRVEPQINQKMATGCFRRFNNFKTPGNYQWHYSGTFFWWRLAEIGKRNWRTVDQKFFGTESWIGHQAHESETGCLLLDDCGDLYRSEYWRDVVNHVLKGTE